MKRQLVDSLVCPVCLPAERKLLVESMEALGNEVLRGFLQCTSCGRQFPIEDGIPDFLPPTTVTSQGRYEQPRVLSSYLWSHYADLFGDEEATAAYGHWSSQLNPGVGMALDVGYAVGRFTFELSRKVDFAVGIDTSREFIRKARELQQTGELEFDLVEEGCLTRRQTIRVPTSRARGSVEFMLADAQALPFLNGAFTCVASLNVVDKIPRPMTHLRELNRVAKGSGAQLLFSDPFSWSKDFAGEEEWLGGLPGGACPGAGLDNVRAILEGRQPGLAPPWTIHDHGSVWWKLRTHRNHFELIRSWYLKAIR
jgi:uncharacterized protein YbaR (Trm112 family)